TGADQPGDPQDLAAGHLETDRLARACRGAKTPHPKPTRAGLARAWDVQILETSAHHTPDHAVVVDLLLRQLASASPLAPRHDPVSAPLDLAQAVRDVDDAHAVLPQVGHGLQDPVRLRQRERARRLV